MRETNPERFIEKGIETIVPMIKETYGSDLCMVALYGSAATGTFIKGVSDINILIVVEHAEAAQLFALAKSARKSLIDYRITPHILSKQELFASADVFPIEYLEIRETMKLLLGENLLEQLEIGDQNVRHQVETMVRGGLNSLRQIILLVSSDEKILRRELLSWGGRQLPLYKSVLRLFKAEPDEYRAHDPREVVASLEKHLGFSCSALAELIDLRDSQASGRPLSDLVSKLLAQYIRLVEAVDGCETER